MNAKLNNVTVTVSAKNIIKESNLKEWDLILVSGAWYSNEEISQLVFKLRMACHRGQPVYIGDPSGTIKYFAHDGELKTIAEYELCDYSFKLLGYRETEVLHFQNYTPKEDDLIEKHKYLINDLNMMTCVSIDMNAKINRVNLKITLENLVGKEKNFQNWDCILIGDLFYDWKVVDPLMPMLREACKEGKAVFLGDPSTIMKHDNKDLTTKARVNKNIMSKQKRKPWRKNLYENEGYPDNYTDKSFLDEMKKNINMRQVSGQEAVLGSGLVTQEFCLVVLFGVAFTYLDNGWLQLELILTQSGLVSMLCYAICLHNQSGRLRHVRTVLVFFIFGYVLSPVLKTLTESISTDTIYAMTVLMMAIHLIFFDYGVKVPIVSSSLSLNSAIFGAICLASRLRSPLHVFILMSITVECFIMLPLVLAKVEGSFVTLLVLVFLTVYSLWTVSLTMTILFVLVVLFINVLCPYLFLKWYRYKDNIYGPWDEAVVSLPTNSHH